jgi:hypothetical protein
MSDELVNRLTILCLLTWVIVPGIAAAQTPAPKPASQPVAGTVKAPEPVGRMFFTPGQRGSLDIARTQRARTTLANERPTEETAPQAQIVTYSGVVKRGDGKSTVWINGRSINDNEAIGGSVVGKIRPDGGITLSVPQSGRSVDLKPGQSIDLLSGTIEEGYSRKPIVAESKPAAKGAPEAKPATKAETQARAEEARELAREERQQQRVEEAVSRAIQETANARPAGVGLEPPPAPAAPAR